MAEHISNGIDTGVDFSRTGKISPQTGKSATDCMTEHVSNGIDTGVDFSGTGEVSPQTGKSATDSVTEHVSNGIDTGVDFSGMEQISPQTGKSATDSMTEHVSNGIDTGVDFSGMGQISPQTGKSATDSMTEHVSNGIDTGVDFSGMGQISPQTGKSATDSMTEHVSNGIDTGVDFSGMGQISPQTGKSATDSMTEHVSNGIDTGVDFSGMGQISPQTGKSATDSMTEHVSNGIDTGVDFSGMEQISSQTGKSATDSMTEHVSNGIDTGVDFSGTGQISPQTGKSATDSMTEHVSNGIDTGVDFSGTEGISHQTGKSATDSMTEHVSNGIDTGVDFSGTGQISPQTGKSATDSVTEHVSNGIDTGVDFSGTGQISPQTGKSATDSVTEHVSNGIDTGVDFSGMEQISSQTGRGIEDSEMGPMNTPANISRGIGCCETEHMPGTTDDGLRNSETKLLIHLYSSAEPFVISGFHNKTVEDVCLQIASFLGLSFLSFSLFGLVDESYKKWLPPPEKIEKFAQRNLFFRVRYFSKLYLLYLHRHFESDNINFLKYFFLQCHSDFTQDVFTSLYANKPLSREKCLGLGVLERVIHAYEKEIPVNKIPKNTYKLSLPVSIQRKMNNNPLKIIRFRRSFSQELQNFTQKDKSSLGDLMLTYIFAIFDDDHYPNYLSEKFNVRIDIREDYHEDLTLQVGSNSDEIEFIGKLKDILSVDVEEYPHFDGYNFLVRVSRCQGPKILRFHDKEEALSLVSFLDGYFRLSVNHYLSICKRVEPPSLGRLHRYCHGPVSLHKCQRKLQERGIYILSRSNTCERHSMDVTFLQDNQTKEMCRLVVKCLPDGMYQFEDKEQTADDLMTLLMKDERTSSLVCPMKRTNGDEMDLLLCKSDKDVPSQRPPSDLALVDKSQLAASEEVLGTGCYTTVLRGNVQVREESRDIYKSVAIKRLRNDVEDMPKCLEFFMKSAEEMRLMKNNFMVKFYGISMSPPFSLLLQYTNSGSLDIFLQNADSNESLLINATLSLMKALFYLSNHKDGLVHGNVRCRNILVFKSSSSSELEFKLSDPGMVHLYNQLPLQHQCNQERIAWIAPELYTDLTKITLETDLYALGTTIWEIWALGKHPPSDITAMTLPVGLTGCQVLLQLGGRLQDAIMAAICSCHEKDPKDRGPLANLLRQLNPYVFKTGQKTLPKSDSSSGHAVNDGSVMDIDNPPRLRGLFFQDGRWKYDNNRHHSTSTSETSGLDFPERNKTRLKTDRRQNPPPLAAKTNSVKKMIPRDRLTIKETIGSGCFGQVSKALLQKGDKEELCAVKTLISGSTSQQGLEQEMEVMFNLIHPNVVELFGFCLRSGNDPFCLVMEYLEKGSLSSNLKITPFPFTEEDIFRISYDVARGMKFLAASKIVHRDLAARNVLLTSSNNAKITDFGLARIMGGSDYYKTQKSNCLPYIYYPPEAINYGRFTEKADVWSYGILLWEIYSKSATPCFLSHPKDNSGLKNLVERLEAGDRLSKPEMCPDLVYHLMKDLCWESNAEKRPTFDEIVIFLDRNWREQASSFA